MKPSSPTSLSETNILVAKIFGNIACYKQPCYYNQYINLSEFAVEKIKA